MPGARAAACATVPCPPASRTRVASARSPGSPRTPRMRLPLVSPCPAAPFYYSAARRPVGTSLAMVPWVRRWRGKRYVGRVGRAMGTPLELLWPALGAALVAVAQLDIL